MAIYTNDPALTKTSYTDLPTAVTAIGSTVTTVYIPNALTISASLVIPANITLFFEASGQITVSSGTLTVNGQVIAPPRQIFFGAGTITLSVKGIMYNEWVGGTSAYMSGTQGSWTLAGGGGSGFAGTYTGPVTFTDNTATNVNLTLSQVANQVGDSFRTQNSFGANLARIDPVGRYFTVGNWNSTAAPGTPTTALAAGGSLTLNQAYQYQVTIASTTDGTETNPSGWTTARTPVTGGTQSITLTFAALAAGQSLKLYRTQGGGTVPFFVTNLTGSTSGTWTYTDGLADTALGYISPTYPWTGIVNVGNGKFDGSSGAFTGGTNGAFYPTGVAMNFISGWNGNFVDFQINGTSWLSASKSYIQYNGSLLINTILSTGSPLNLYSDFANRPVAIQARPQQALMWQDGILTIESLFSSWTSSAHSPGRLAMFDGHGSLLVFGGLDTSATAAPANAPTLNANNTTGGTLPAGTYVYYYSFVETNTTGKETLLSPASSTITTTGSTSSVVINVNTTATPANYAINIYRTNVNGTIPFYLTQVGGGTTTWTDTGGTNTSNGITGQWMSPVRSASQGTFSVGEGPWDGRSTGAFVGSANGTGTAGNFVGTFTGNFEDYQLAGISKYSVNYQGNATFAGTVTATSLLPAAGTTTVPPVRLTAGTNLTTPLSGVVEYDGKTFFTTAGGATRRILPATMAGATATTSVINTTTETVLATITIPSNELNVVGRQINVELFGRYSTSATPPTLTIRARLGTVTGTVIWNTTPTTFTPTASASGAATTLGATTWPFNIVWNGTVITTGATGSLWPDGYVQYATTATAISTASPSAPAAAIGSLNLSGTSNIVITLQMGTAATSHIFAIDQVFYTIS